MENVIKKEIQKNEQDKKNIESQNEVIKDNFAEYVTRLNIKRFGQGEVVTLKKPLSKKVRNFFQSIFNVLK